MKKSRGMSIAAIILTAASFSQWIGLIRYRDRMPDDTIGIVLFLLTAVFLGIAAFGFFTQWSKEKKAEQS
ncbi:MAG TPA: hypothetical protein ENN25_00935 [Euryarchaeota archaeon]|nr:hypothetical protein [Euryarchaeota archaeon]